MVKEQTQKLDVEFIREYEELKIKQKLLIESLKKKGQTQESELFIDVNSKLDFLVKIFKDSMKEDEEEKEGKVNFEESVIEKIDALMEKLTKVEENFEKRFTEIESKFSPKNVEKENSLDSLLPESNVQAPPIEKTVEKNASLPPLPDFKAEITGKSNSEPSLALKELDDIKIDGKKEKKKWF